MSVTLVLSVVLLVAIVVVAVLRLVLALLDGRRGSFRSIYERDVSEGRARGKSAVPIEEADLAHLPPLVQTYLRRVGVVGRPRIREMYLHWVGRMKTAPDAGFTAIEAEQTSFFDAPARLFHIRGSRAGIPFDGYHRYVGRHATMQIRIAGLFGVVDARGPEMDQSETVTFFNDMCILAPATLVDAPVEWRTVDEHTVHARFTNAGHTIEAELVFDDAGDLCLFVSNDRYLTADGKTYERLPWSTPVHGYRLFDGVRIASHGEAIWERPEGELVYGVFEIVELSYDAGRSRSFASSDATRASRAATAAASNR